MKTERLIAHTRSQLQRALDEKDNDAVIRLYHNLNLLKTDRISELEAERVRLKRGTHMIKVTDVQSGLTEYINALDIVRIKPQGIRANLFLRDGTVLSIQEDADTVIDLRNRALANAS